MTEHLDVAPNVYVLLARTPCADSAFVQDFDGQMWLLTPSSPLIEPTSVEAMQYALDHMDFISDASEHFTWLEIYNHLSDVAEQYRRNGQ